MYPLITRLTGLTELSSSNYLAKTTWPKLPGKGLILFSTCCFSEAKKRELKQQR